MSEQEMLDEFDRDMREMEKCTTYTRSGSECSIKCILGLWEVKGPDGMQLINEASHYFEQYKRDGEYSDILGGPTNIDVLKKARAALKNPSVEIR